MRCAPHPPRTPPYGGLGTPARDGAAEASGEPYSLPHLGFSGLQTALGLAFCGMAEGRWFGWWFLECPCKGRAGRVGYAAKDEGGDRWRPKMTMLTFPMVWMPWRR